VIKSGGEWISSIDLENIAIGHPAVRRLLFLHDARKFMIWSGVLKLLSLGGFLVFLVGL
jgi:acyl-CoA synthetase (AMP-forming)/AMP-acid ligase II